MPFVVEWPRNSIPHRLGRGIPRWLVARPAPGQEHEEGVNRLVGIDRLVAEGDVDILAVGDDLGDVRPKPVRMASVMNIR